MSSGQVIQEQQVSDAFSRQSASFDDIYDNNPITVWMRDRVRNQVMRYLKSGEHMLELNCGTGTDSIFFARQGLHVLATDNADGMLHQLAQKVEAAQLQDRITIHKASFNNLTLPDDKQFDHVFSNFSGLNCTDNLVMVLHNIDAVIKPGGYFTLVIMPKICPWEITMLLKGQTKLAFRRFGKNGASAHIEGLHFQCYYYNVSTVINTMKDQYKLCALKGLASLVPPPSLEYFPAKYPRVFSFLQKTEDKISDKFPFNRWCDQYAITMQKG